MHPNRLRVRSGRRTDAELPVASLWHCTEAQTKTAKTVRQATGGAAPRRLERKDGVISARGGEYGDIVTNEQEMRDRLRQVLRRGRGAPSIILRKNYEVG